MKRLYDLVELAVNNEECVVLKVKNGAAPDLIGLGYFEGDETMFRLTKGSSHVCTVFREGRNPYSWHWGWSGDTMVTWDTRRRGEIIQQCIEKDFGICIS